VEPDVDAGAGRGTDPDAASAGQRVRSRLASPFSALFSLRLFVVVLGLTAVGMVLGSLLVPLPGAGLAGIALAGFVVGVARDDRRYLELLLAGFVTAGLGTVFEYAFFALFGGFAPVALGTTAGGLAAIAGHYFGRDLRSGLLREV
jgi:hypothetical protein